jgi:Flp pilus assembly protein TadD
MIQWLKDFWAAHGTKILGLASAAAGGAGEALTYIQQLDPKHAAIWGVVILLGVAIVRRGFTNSARLAQ